MLLCYVNITEKSAFSHSRMYEAAGEPLEIDMMHFSAIQRLRYDCGYLLYHNVNRSCSGPPSRV